MRGCYNKYISKYIYEREGDFMKRANAWESMKKGFSPLNGEHVQVAYLGYFDKKLYSDGSAYYDKSHKWHWSANDMEPIVEIIAWRPFCKPFDPADSFPDESWVPVDRLLPDYGNPVQVTYRGKDGKIYADDFACLEESGWCWCLDDSDVNCEILAWKEICHYE